jgi:hypothetical protein
MAKITTTCGNVIEAKNTKNIALKCLMSLRKK